MNTSGLASKVVLAAALVGATVTVSVVSRAQAPQAAAAKPPVGGKPAGVAAWEYKQVFRTRGWHKTTQKVEVFGVVGTRDSYWYEFDDWVTNEDGTKLAPGTDMKTLLMTLGTQGWELVSVTPISSVAGANESTAMAGATSEMLYWLKRPKK